MAVFHPHQVRCKCGKSLVVQLADSINVKRAPQLREEILAGRLHLAHCSACKQDFLVEKPFHYSDFSRKALFKVLPRGERHTWKQQSQRLEAASSLVPDGVAGEERTLRVLFGMDELREKLVAQDHQLDDRELELLKVLLIYEHPVLLRKPRLRLTLHAVSSDELQFNALYEHDAKQFRVTLPREIAAALTGSERLRSWPDKTHKESIFGLRDHWVNLWRWSPQPTALARLRAFAHDIADGRGIDASSSDFERMLEKLPRGTHLPPWAKQDLRTLFEYAKQRGLAQVQDALFEIRFGIELENDWSTNDDVDDIDTLWMLLKDLPDTNVEGNTKIRELLLEVGEGGGFYRPSSHDIAIGSNELGDRERFEDIVRHEVAHAVHEMRSGFVDAWLAQRFGWLTFGSDDAGIDQWVALMGGWSTLTHAQRRDVAEALRSALGRGSSWSPGATPTLPPSHPWNRPDFGPRLAFEKTGANWFGNFRTWYRANGKAFYLNYWYRTLIAVDTATLELVGDMPDPYAAMSHFEFFAELYALHYDLDDPKRQAIPADVRDWIDTNLGQAATGAPMPANPAAKKEWETVTRPSGE